MVMCKSVKENGSTSKYMHFCNGFFPLSIANKIPALPRASDRHPPVPPLPLCPTGRPEQSSLLSHGSTRGEGTLCDGDML